MGEPGDVERWLLSEVEGVNGLAFELRVKGD